ncbi:DEKNAAC100722 [Brettanomyces naardenensis]|uniref:SAGA-associated factor 11 n=1 Tax=Brettanomyces naardenensis TaxID=13370 RepID=A0A448YFX8_BRENA|nr:DEKNAAC100722 [Brettanomyces naardenensis]
MLNEKLTEQRYGTLSDPKFINSRNEAKFPKSEADASTLASLRKRHHGHGHNSTDGSRSATPQPVDLQKEPDIGRFEFDVNGRDIYQNALVHNGPLMGDKALEFASTNGADIYFRCSNCQREIAGSRFAAHLDKCLGGRSRKIRD